MNLVGADLVPELVDHVAQNEGSEESEGDRDADLHRVVAACVDPSVLLEQQDSELAESGVSQHLAILGLVHPEAARAA